MTGEALTARDSAGLANGMLVVPYPISPGLRMFTGLVLPAMTVDIVRKGANTFPCQTGLGWDKLHPRAIARLSDEALLALIRTGDALLKHDASEVLGVQEKGR